MSYLETLNNLTTRALNDIEEPVDYSIINSYTRADKPEDYKNIGINIVAPGAVNGGCLWPYVFTDEFGPIEVGYESTYGPVTIPRCRNIYSYNGGIRFLKEPLPERLGFKTICITNYQHSGHEIAPDLIPVAVVKGNTIILLWELSSLNDCNVALLQYVLRESIQHFKQTPTIQLVIPREQKMAVMFKSLIDRNYQIAVRNLSGYQSESQEYLERYIEYQRKAMECQISIARLEESRKRQDLAQEFITHLSKNKKVSKYDFDDNHLKLWLKDLVIRYERKTIHLPHYLVSINVTDGSMHVSLSQGDRQWNITPIHPHVFSEGKVCLGNFTKIYAKIVAKGEWTQLIDLIVEFFQSYNPDSPVPGARIDKFIAMITYNRPMNDIDEEEYTRANSLSIINPPQ